MSLSAADRRRIEDLVRPLYQGLDGVDGWPRVERLEATARRLAEGRDVDPSTLELLALLHGVADRLGGARPDGRLALALRSLESTRAEAAAVVRSLGRWRHAPATDEERALHDAHLLDQTGLEACLGRLLEAGRRKVPLDRALAQLDPGPDAARFTLPRAAALAADRRTRVERWLADLARRLGEERQEPDDRS